MNMTEAVLVNKRQENGGRNNLWALWSIAEKNFISSKLTSVFFKIEKVLRDSGAADKLVYQSLAEAMEALMYVHLNEEGLVNNVDPTTHNRYKAIVAKAFNAIKQGGVVTAGMGGGGVDFTVQNDGKTSNAAHFDVVHSTAAPVQDPFRKPVQEAELAAPLQEIILEQPSTAIETVPVATIPQSKANQYQIKDKFMLNYEYHELSVAYSNSTNTVRHLNAEVKKYTDGNRKTEEIVKMFLENDLSTVKLDEVGLCSIEMSERHLPVTFTRKDEIEYVLNEEGDVADLCRVFKRINDFDESMYDVDDLVRTMSQFVAEIKDILDNMAGKKSYYKMASLASVLRMHISDTLKKTWVAVTGEELPPSYAFDTVAEARMMHPLTDLAKFYNEVYVKYYTNDNGMVKEETFITNIALTVLKALRGFAIQTEEIGDAETNEVVSVCVSVYVQTYHILLDCNIQTDLTHGQLNSLVGSLAPAIETIYHSISKHRPNATVNLVAGNVLVRVVGSDDESNVCYFVNEL